MRFHCPICRRVFMATTATVAVCCGLAASHLDDEPVHLYPQQIVMRPVVISTSTNVTWGTGPRSGSGFA
jgi:hypothetical protein